MFIHFTYAWWDESIPPADRCIHWRLSKHWMPKSIDYPLCSTLTKLPRHENFSSMSFLSCPAESIVQVSRLISHFLSVLMWRPASRPFMIGQRCDCMNNGGTLKSKIFSCFPIWCLRDTVSRCCSPSGKGSSPSIDCPSQNCVPIRQWKK